MLDKNERENIVNGLIASKEYAQAFSALKLLIDLVNIEIIQNESASQDFYSSMEYYRKNDSQLYQLSKKIYDTLETFSDCQDSSKEDLVIKLKNLYDELSKFESKNK